MSRMQVALEALVILKHRCNIAVLHAVRLNICLESKMGVVGS
jgi:hypothetical protein